MLFFSSILSLFFPLVFLLLHPLQKEKQALFESTPDEQRSHIWYSLKWLIKKSDKLIHRHGWMSEVTPHSSRALCARALVFNSISSMAAQYFFFQSCIGQQPYLLRFCPSGSPSTQHGQQSTYMQRVHVCVCARECMRVVCAEQAHWYTQLRSPPLRSRLHCSFIIHSTGLIGSSSY